MPKRKRTESATSHAPFHKTKHRMRPLMRHQNRLGGQSIRRGVIEDQVEHVAPVRSDVVEPCQSTAQKDPHTAESSRQIKRKTQTFRISQLPMSTTDESIKQWLKSENPLVSLNETELDVIQLSLAKWGESKKQAVVTFKDISQAIANLSPEIDGPDGAIISLDNHFRNITILHDGSTGGNIAADIVAVHGLGGHAIGSWKSPDSHRVWLRDFLPTEIPNARIMTYGYDTNLKDGAWKKTIDSLAKDLLENLSMVRNAVPERPLVFISHSLGGLIIKEALVICAQQQQDEQSYRHILNSCSGVVFFAVPHHGIRFDQLRDVTAGKGSQNFVLDMLLDDDNEGSQYLSKLNDSFVHAMQHKNLNILAYYEHNRTDASLKELGHRSAPNERSDPLMVTRISASYIGLQKRCNIFGLDGDHRSLVKFKTIQDCEKVLFRIKQLVGEFKDTIGETDQIFRANVTDEQKQSLFESLGFQQMDARHLNVRKAHSKTCKWFFDESYYRIWSNRSNIEQHHGFLWIKGKPGSGKSIIMKEAVAQASRKAQKRADKAVIKFFFNARAKDILEKSVLGMYRSLCHQLLEKFPDLQDYFAEEFKSKVKYSDSAFEWYVPELQNFLSDVVERLGQRSLFIFVDALDECAEKDIRRMVVSMQETAQRAMDRNILLNICFSSRHYPQIKIDPAISLVLEDQIGHERDITTYISSKLATKSSPRLKALAEKIRCKALGVFLWVALVVDILNELDDKGEIDAMEKRFNEIPEDLDALFESILTRYPADKKTAVQLFQWTLFAQRALEPIELYCAMKSDNAPMESETTANVEEEDLRKFINNQSKGLAEITKSRPAQVQFIHETVNTFFLQENGLARIQGVPHNDIIGLSHDQLKRRCLDYITLAHVQDTKLEWVINQLPFLKYSVANIFHHGNMAERQGVSQELFLKSATSGPNEPIWQKWIALNNLFEKHEVRKYTSNATMIYVFSDKNFVGLVDRLIQSKADINASGERYGNALQAACSHGHQEIIHLLLNANAVVNVREGECGHALFAAAQKGRFDVVKLLIPYTTRFEANDTKYWKAVRSATKHEYTQILQQLLEMNTNKNFERALQLAVVYGHNQIVQLLLDAGADVNKYNGISPLYTASEKGCKQIVQMLVNAGANVNVEGGFYSNALQAASLNGDEQIVLLLLNAGADVNAQGGPCDNALQAASVNGHEQVVQLLLDAGATSIEYF